MSVSGYDLVVIGSGPAGQKAAIAAAKNHRRAAVIDRTTMIGGVCVHTGTIPSKAVREAIFQLTGPAVKALYGDRYKGSEDISIKELSSWVKDIIARETQVIRAQLKRNGVAVYQGRSCRRTIHPNRVETTVCANQVGDNIQPEFCARSQDPSGRYRTRGDGAMQCDSSARWR